MPRILQLRWSDEEVWKTIGEIASGRTDEEVINCAQEQHLASAMKYGLTFYPSFRVIDNAQKA